MVGSDLVTSVTWQFWVGASSASTAVDTSHGPILDVNGDGFADLLIGGDGATTTTRAGGAHLYFGAKQVSVASWNAAASSSRTDLSLPEEDGFGQQVANAGDVNGDGFADFLIASYGVATGSNVVHFYFGSATPRAADWSGTAPPGRIDLVNPGAASGFGNVMAAAGDVNGDGFADFVIGSGLVGNTPGAAYLYLGSATPGAAGWNGSAATARIELVDPATATDSFGSAVAGAGDINGDGFADFVVSAIAQGPGAARVYLGGADVSAADWNGASAGRRIDLVGPDSAHEQFGYAVAATGDVNGDGFGDFVIGANEAAYFYLGSATPGPAGWLGSPAASRIDLGDAGSPLGFGSTAAGAGDVNGDGFTDFVIGISGFQTNVGAAELYLGSAAPSAASWNGAGARRIRLTSPDGADVYSWALGGGGDINGDLNADFLVNSLYASVVHVYLGSTTASGTGWNGGAPGLRLDLSGPGDVIGFGAALAGEEPTCTARYSLWPRHSARCSHRAAARRAPSRSR
jgi:hypothetical protein